MNIHEIPKVARPWMLIQNIENETEEYKGREIFLQCLLEFLDSHFLGKRIFKLDEIEYREKLITSIGEKCWELGFLNTKAIAEFVSKCPPKYVGIINSLVKYQEWHKNLDLINKQKYPLKQRRVQLHYLQRPNTKVEILYNFCLKQ